MTGTNHPKPRSRRSKTNDLFVIDLFSCGGGMSAGFSGRKNWKLAAAVDLEVAKPSGKVAGETGCNAVYAANHGLTPLDADLMEIAPQEVLRRAGLTRGDLGCLISCAPCTDFSRANPANHGSDKHRNTLVGRSGEFISSMRPMTFVMENARELLTGNHPQHWRGLKARLEAEGYNVSSEVHFLSRFGLPQVRERALITAHLGGMARTLEDLWEGWEVDSSAVTVRTALNRLAEWQEAHPDDETGDVYPGMGESVLARIAMTPHDGGGWVDLARDPDKRHALTPDCKRRWEIKDLGSHPDVYGRLWWDRPSPTIKRECAHVGNGRYTHPEHNRLLTVREMATLQGFPFTYKFPSRSIANRYRVIGDAVPPVIAWQIRACVDWMITGKKPDPAEWIMPNTTLRLTDLKRSTSVRKAA